MPKPPSPALCPCGGGAYASCCGPFLAGDAIPPSAEQLMRSRYTAYTLRLEDYLRATWHASTVPVDAIVDPDEKVQWLGLEVKSALRLRLRQRKANLPEEQQSDDDRDTVEFVARFKVGGRAHRLHEVSSFVRAPDSLGALRWFYVDGSFPAK